MMLQMDIDENKLPDFLPRSLKEYVGRQLDMVRATPRYEKEQWRRDMCNVQSPTDTMQERLEEWLKVWPVLQDKDLQAFWHMLDDKALIPAFLNELAYQIPQVSQSIAYTKTSQSKYDNYLKVLHEAHNKLLKAREEEGDIDETEAPINVCIKLLETERDKKQQVLQAEWIHGKEHKDHKDWLGLFWPTSTVIAEHVIYIKCISFWIKKHTGAPHTKDIFILLRDIFPDRNIARLLDK